MQIRVGKRIGSEALVVDGLHARTDGLISLAVMLAAAGSWIVNHYLTVTVRIQEDREHQVVSAGPYRFVRHPMYVGVMSQAICMPLALGSWVGLIPGVLIAAAFVWRTAQEDSLYQAELVGYSDYAGQVRY